MPSISYLYLLPATLRRLGGREREAAGLSDDALAVADCDDDVP